LEDYPAPAIMNKEATNPSNTCPCCGSTVIKAIRSRKTVSVSGDRYCQSCGAKWSPPVSKAAAAAMMFFCALLAIVLLVVAFGDGFGSAFSFWGGVSIAACASFVFAFFKALRVFRGEGGELDVYERPATRQDSKP
jgi:hypothetical protein